MISVSANQRCLNRLWLDMEFLYMTDSCGWYISRNRSSVLSWYDHTFESQFCGFYDTFFEEKHIFYYTSKRDFSEVECISERCIGLRAHERSDTGEIDTRFCEWESPTDISIDIIAFEFCISEFCHHSDEKFQFCLWDTPTRSFWIAKFGIRRQRLYLDEKRAISLEGESESTSWKLARIRIDKFEPRIRYIDEPTLLHTKESDSISRSKSIF
jgi:hypothetical protein